MHGGGLLRREYSNRMPLRPGGRGGISIFTTPPMKRLLTPAVATLLLLSAPSAFAQLSSGHLMLGGQFGFSSDKPADGDPDAESKTTTGTFSPRVGYFLMDNLAVGLELQYGGSKEEETDIIQEIKLTSTTKRTSLLVGPFARYYQPVGEKAAFFGHLSLGFGSSKKSVEYSGTGAPTNPKDEKFGMTEISLRPGFTYFPTKRLGLEIMTDAIKIGYSSRKQKDLESGLKEDDYTSSSFVAKADLMSLLTLGSVQIGATFYFGGGE